MKNTGSPFLPADRAGSRNNAHAAHHCVNAVGQPGHETVPLSVGPAHITGEADVMTAFPFTHRTIEQIDGRRRPIPNDFADIAPNLSFNAILSHYKAGASAVYRWMKESGVECRQWQPMRPVPDDFAERCAELTKVQLFEHYRTHSDIVSRWLRETGLSPKRFAAPPRAEKPQPVRAIKPKAFAQMGNPHKAVITTRTKSLWDEAADTLRAERWTVHRCNERGAYAENGQFWRVGNVVVSPDELLRRAAKYERIAA